MYRIILFLLLIALAGDGRGVGLPIKVAMSR